MGSSDSHNAGRTEDFTQSPIGEATTVVFAPELSERGIRQAVLQGHAYIKFFSSDGPDLRFEAVALNPSGKPRGRGRPKAIMGDRLNSSSAEFTARVTGAMPDPEARLLLVMKDGYPHLAVPVTSNDLVFTFAADSPGDYRLQLMRGTAIEGLSNPISLGTP
ncbi:MAG: hypothetical protein ACRDJJ_08240 [Actinomycetota bacterium]